MEAIRVERSDGLVTITLERPEKKNALDAQCWNDLERTFAELTLDPDARAVILTGAGGNFSAGADLSGNKSGLGLTGRPVQPIVRRCASSATSSCASRGCRSRRSPWSTACAWEWRWGSRSPVT